ncbi:hypothetical protein Nstercoris_01984 [Nitrosomonas stercoris]|uniref:Outer membrane protein TolC n=1 Tax=Nitrosomonas stercoris TaxID=1444684 RepID=A0A4Y1YPP9_9PROT|nr:hypothetical protein Nstercoris_01984 [Nitrosomonas stercoris]
MRILFIIFVSLISSSPALSELIEPPEEQLNAFTQALGIEKTSSLSIKEAVYFVLSQHPSVKNALGFEERAKEIINISKSRYYPQISGGISSSYDRYRTGRYQNKYLQDMELNVEQMLYDFGKTSNSVKKSEYGSFKTKARTQLIVERLIEEVSRTVIEIVRYQNLTRLAQKLAQEITGLTILVEKRHAKGASTLSDVLQARSRKDSAKTLIIESRAQHKQWLQQLALLTNVQMLVYASLKDFPVELEKSCQFKDIKWDLVPEVVMADMAAEEASVDMELAKAQEWPTLLLQAGISRPINATPIHGSRFDNHIQLSFTMPLYQGGGLSANKRAAAGALRAAMAETMEVRLEIRQRLAELVSQHKSLQESSQLLRERVKNIEGTKELYKKQYLDLGTRTMVDLLNAEQEYHQARVDVMNYVFDMKVLQVECAFMQGLLAHGFDVAALY